MKGKKLFRVGTTLSVVIVTLMLVSWFSNTAAAGSGEFAPGRILVKFKQEAKIAEIHAANATKTTKIIPGLDVHVVSLPPGKGVQQMVEQFKKARGVEYAEPDYIAYADAIPDDTSFGSQWGMNNTGQSGGTADADIDAPEAWDITTGDSGVIIAILDTGIDEDHVDLSGKVDPDLTTNFTTSPTSDDIYGHGTHCAGIAAANTNNNIGVAGVGYNCSLMNVKVLGDDGYGSYSWISNGITYATNNGAHVISMSLSGSSSSTTLKNAIDYAWAHNVVVVAAAGNNGSSTPRYPAYYDNCIAVAATDRNDNKASFSNYGDWVDVAAPGVSIYSSVPNNGYANYNGTSMATPHVAGLAGLLWSTSYGTSSSSVRNRIESTADQIPNTGNYWIWGRINAFEAVKVNNTIDIAAIEVSAPISVVQGDVVNVAVTVKNVGSQDVTSNINVTLTDDTDGANIGTQTIGGGLVVGESRVLTYSWDTTGASITDHTLTAAQAFADDNASNDSMSIVVAVDSGVDDPPSVSITAPGNGELVSDVTVVTANASDDDLVMQVEFFVNGANIGTGTSNGDSWSINWVTGDDDDYTLTAAATDTASQTTTSADVVVTVDNTPPSVDITSPSNGANVSGSNVNVTASASDFNGGVVMQVEFFVDGSSIGVDGGSGNGWSADWDTTGYVNDSYTLTAEATDGAGLRTTSAGVDVIVDNSVAENALYVWDISWSEEGGAKPQGKGKKSSGAATGLIVTVTVKQDSDGDGKAERRDAAVQDVIIELVVVHESGVSWTDSITTDRKGKATLTIESAPIGDYMYTATVMAIDGVPCGSMDVDNPDYYFGFPGGSE